MHVILLAFSFVCFVVSFWSPANWNRLISVGLALLVASMLPW